MSSVWTRHDYEGVTIWQRLCPDCDFGLLLGPARFCGRCGGRGFLTTEHDPTIEELTGREDESAGRPGPEREAGITPGGDRADVRPSVAASRPAGDNVTHAIYPLAGIDLDGLEGQWVAIRGDQVIGAAARLERLFELDEVADTDVLYLVPDATQIFKAHAVGITATPIPIRVADYRRMEAARLQAMESWSPIVKNPLPPTRLWEVLPRTDLSVDDARQKLAGWHFAQESLTPVEREILYVAEAVLRGYDQLENRLEHSERHRSSNRRTMRQRGRMIERLCTKIAHQRDALRGASGKRATSIERGADLHHSLRSGPDA